MFFIFLNVSLSYIVADKLHWTFKLYDKDGSGEIGLQNSLFRCGTFLNWLLSSLPRPVIPAPFFTSPLVLKSLHQCKRKSYFYFRPWGNGRHLFKSKFSNLLLETSSFNPSLLDWIKNYTTHFWYLHHTLIWHFRISNCSDF